MNPECSVSDCGSPILAKGLCGKHYQRKLNTGTTDPRPKLRDGLCSCGERFALYKTLDGELLEHPLCQKCFRRAQRDKVSPLEFVCARLKCGKRFTSRYNHTSRTRYCSRHCKERARSEEGLNAEAAARHYYKSRYGLTPEEASRMQTTGTCEICDGAPSVNGRWGNLHLDHDHKTGKRRGMLCSECNNALGKFHDDPALLQKAIDYLMRYAAVT